MKVLLISDLHFHNYKAHSEVVDGINSRLLDIAGAVKAAFKIAQENGCSLCIIAGDIFHVRGSIRPSTLTFVAGLFEELAAEIPILIIPGNHDMEEYSGGATAIDTLCYIDGIDVITEAVAFDIKSDLKIIAIPYVHNIKDFEDTFKELSAKWATEDTVTIMHQGIDLDGAPSFLSDGGVSAGWLESVNPGSIFSGHYHDPTTDVDARAINIGAPCQLTFGDVGCERGCYIFDSKTKKKQFFSLLEFAPKFIDVSADTKKMDNVTGNFIRIHSASKAEASKIHAKIKKAGAKSWTVVLEKEFKTAHEVAISVDKPARMLVDYIDLQEKYKPFKTEILKLYNEVCIA